MLLSLLINLLLYNKIEHLIPYPVTKENFHAFLEKNAVEWTDSAYVATETNGEIIGFFCYSINVDDNAGFLKFVIVDHNKRGTGYGKEMLLPKRIPQSS